MHTRLRPKVHRQVVNLFFKETFMKTRISISPRTYPRIGLVAMTSIATACAIVGGMRPSVALSAELTARIVTFQDLDLANDSGIAALYGRLSFAAQDVCRPLDTLRIEDHFRYKHCVRAAMAHAIAEIDEPALTAHYQTKSAGSNMRAGSIAHQ
jgi:UrcA family protein